jgi:hypothetical protein
MPPIDEKYGDSFLIQAGELEINCHQYQHPSFVPALAAVLEAVSINEIPYDVAALFGPFIASYQV